MHFRDFGDEMRIDRRKQSRHEVVARSTKIGNAA
jgi:hypothetical protein